MLRVSDARLGAAVFSRGMGALVGCGNNGGGLHRCHAWAGGGAGAGWSGVAAGLVQPYRDPGCGTQQAAEEINLKHTSRALQLQTLTKRNRPGSVNNEPLNDFVVLRTCAVLALLSPPLVPESASTRNPLGAFQSAGAVEDPQHPEDYAPTSSTRHPRA
ncbi:hypothetical protein OPT61_g1536 [Boeremia exigua]|uniref:Uncharacterized protein n=1 Tax=Boeremia exigua TaxID=749465 RepID=A0ACC2IPP7_9PLEO|nr:hypothetical protein OPT61_g1536 [Boeremia exigua]